MLLSNSFEKRYQIINVPYALFPSCTLFPFLLAIADPAVEKVSIDKIRFFRVERSYAVRSGKWYFEFEVVTGGDMRVGWARPGCRPDIALGADDQAFVFEGSRVSLDTSSVQVFFFLQTFPWELEVPSVGLWLQNEWPPPVANLSH